MDYRPWKFRTKKWIKVNDDARGRYDKNSRIKFKTTMQKSSLCDYSDGHIIGKGTITITWARAGAAAKNADTIHKKVKFKNCAPFADCISKINNTLVDNAKHLDVVMQIYNLIEYRYNYAKASRRLWQYYKDNPYDKITDCESFKFKAGITGRTSAAGNTNDAEIIVLLKYLSNFWGTLEMSLINCEINLILTSSVNCFMTNSTCGQIFETTDTKFYVPVVTLSTQDSKKLPEQLN